MPKSSKINLYHSNSEENPNCQLLSSSSKNQLKSSSILELEGSSIALVNTADQSKNITDLCDFLSTLGSASSVSTAQTDATTANNRCGVVEGDITDLGLDIIAEQNARTASISAEAQARTVSISAEAQARTSSFNTLQSAITAEATSRGNSVSTLSSAISVQEGRIDAILAGTSVDLNSLIEVINAYQSADASVLNSISTLTSNLASLQSSFDSLVGN